MNKLLYRIYKLAQNKERSANIFDMFSEEFSRVLKTMPESGKFVNPSISLLEFFENDSQVNKLINFLNSKLTLINFHELKTLAQDLSKEEYSHPDLDMNIENLENNLKTLFNEFTNKLKEYDAQNMSGMMKDFGLLSVCYNLIYLSNIKLKSKQNLPVNINDKFIDEKTKSNIIKKLFNYHLDYFKILNPQILTLDESFYISCFFLLEVTYGKQFIKIEINDSFKNALYSLLNYYFLEVKYIDVLKKVLESNIFQDGEFAILMDIFLSKNLNVFNNPEQCEFIFEVINDNLDLVKSSNARAYRVEFIQGVLKNNEKLKTILKSNLNLQKDFKQYVVNLIANELDILNTSSEERLQLKERLYQKLIELNKDDNSIFDERIIPIGIFGNNKPMSFIDLISH